MNRVAIEHEVGSYACKVLSVMPLNQRTFEIELQSEEGVSLRHWAGQYLQLEVDVNDDGKLHSLSYTIASRFNPKLPSADYPKIQRILWQDHRAFN